MRQRQALARRIRRAMLELVNRARIQIVRRGIRRIRGAVRLRCGRLVEDKLRNVAAQRRFQPSAAYKGAVAKMASTCARIASRRASSKEASGLAPIRAGFMRPTFYRSRPVALSQPPRAFRQVERFVLAVVDVRRRRRLRKLESTFADRSGLIPYSKALVRVLDERAWRSHRESLLRAAALRQLRKKGYVPPIRPPLVPLR